MTNLTPSLPISEANSAALLQTLTAGKTRRSTENRLAYYRSPQHPLRMGGGRGHVSHSAGDGCGDGNAWRDDRAARTRVQLEPCPDLVGFGASHPVVRPVRSVRRRLHE